MTGQKQVERLVETFGANIEAYRSGGYNEAQLWRVITTTHMIIG